MQIYKNTIPGIQNTYWVIINMLNKHGFTPCARFDSTKEECPEWINTVSKNI